MQGQTALLNQDSAKGFNAAIAKRYQQMPLSLKLMEQLELISLELFQALAPTSKCGLPDSRLFVSTLARSSVIAPSTEVCSPPRLTEKPVLTKVATAASKIFSYDSTSPYLPLRGSFSAEFQSKRPLHPRAGSHKRACLVAKKINFLIIALIVGKVSIPIAWRILPAQTKQGNSNARHRIDLTKKLLKTLPASEIKALTMDWEFIGKKWRQW